MNRQFIWVKVRAYGEKAEVGNYSDLVPFDMIERDLSAHADNEFGVIRLYEVNHNGTLTLVRTYGAL